MMVIHYTVGDLFQSSSWLNNWPCHHKNKMYTKNTSDHLYIMLYKHVKQCPALTAEWLETAPGVSIHEQKTTDDNPHDNCVPL